MGRKVATNLNPKRRGAPGSGLPGLDVGQNTKDGRFYKLFTNGPIHHVLWLRMFSTIKRMHWMVLLAMILAGCSHQQQAPIIKIGQSQAAVTDSLKAVGALDIGERFQVMSLGGEQGYPKDLIWEISEHKIMLTTGFSEDKLVHLSLSNTAKSRFPESKEHIPDWTKIESITFNKDKSFSATESR